jgi:hypothetical protein
MRSPICDFYFHKKLSIIYNIQLHKIEFLISIYNFDYNKTIKFIKEICSI